MATNDYPKGQDPREVYADYLAKNIRRKAGDLEEAADNIGKAQPADGIPPNEVPGVLDGPRGLTGMAGLTGVGGTTGVAYHERYAGATGYQGATGIHGRFPVYEENTPRHLRPIRQPMYDRVILTLDTLRAIAFQLPLGVADLLGHSKTYRDTNMTMSGCLGTPLEYDLDSISICPSGAGENYIRQWDLFIQSGPVLKLFIGVDGPLLTVPVVMMTERFPFNYEEDRHGAPEILRHAARNVPLQRDFSFVTERGERKRITSTEYFRAEVDLVDFWRGDGMFAFYVVMNGTLYTA